MRRALLYSLPQRVPFLLATGEHKYGISRSYGNGYIEVVHRASWQSSSHRILGSGTVSDTGALNFTGKCRALNFPCSAFIVKGTWGVTISAVERAGREHFAAAAAALAVISEGMEYLKLSSQILYSTLNFLYLVFIVKEVQARRSMTLNPRISVSLSPLALP